MLDLRLKGLKLFGRKPMPTWGSDLSGIDFDNIKYFVRSTEKQAASWDDLPEDIKNTYDKLGIPEAEKQRLVAGVAAQYESEVVYHSIREDLEEQGVIFLDTDTALKEHPELFQEYFGTVIPVGDNKFAALNTSVWSGGSFIYVPKGVHVDIPLQAYFRINTENMGQFERTLIIVDEDAYVHYVEGCTAPIYSSSDSLHSAVVEIIVKKGGRCRYTTIQNWSNNVYNLVTKRATCEAGATMEWVDGNIGSKVTMKYPADLPDGRARQGRDAVDRVRRRGSAPGRRRQDGARRAEHLVARSCRKSVARGGGRTSYRGLIQINEGAHGSKSNVLCDALLVDQISRSDTYPYVDIREDDVSMGHEASVSKVSDDQLFYLMSRGMSRGRGDGDDRARLRRADRQGAADGVRPRAQPAHRAADGRGGRLSPTVRRRASRRRPSDTDSHGDRLDGLPRRLIAAAPSPASVSTSPSFDVADHPVPDRARGGLAVHAAQAAARAARRHAVATGTASRSRSTRPTASRVETVGRERRAARQGRRPGRPGRAPGVGGVRAGAPSSPCRTEAELDRADHGHPARHRRRRGAAYGHLVVDVGAFAEATVVLDHVGTRDPAPTTSRSSSATAPTLTVVALQDWDDDAVHLGQHAAQVGRDARCSTSRSPSAATSSG